MSNLLQTYIHNYIKSIQNINKSSIDQIHLKNITEINTCVKHKNKYNIKLTKQHKLYYNIIIEHVSIIC